ncbi:MAG: HAD-IIB family hydrolase [Candidatus Bathyarchaeia archaeon]
MNNKTCKVIVYADIDGSLLSSKYEAETIEPILRQLLELKASVVFDSSKTQAEIEHYRKKWGIKDPYIVENGSAIFIPKNYFQQNIKFTEQTTDYEIVKLGKSYSDIRDKLAAAKKQTGAKLKGFGDMSAYEIAEDSGLPLSLAELAKKRQYSEPFKILSGNEDEVIRALTSQGLCITRGGIYLHVIGDTDKGKAAAILKQLYKAEFVDTQFLGVGDSANDLPMLKIVDRAFWVDEKNPREKVWGEILALAQTSSAKTG